MKTNSFHLTEPTDERVTAQRQYRPMHELRWFAFRPQDHNPTLQQAWAPIGGGHVEWRDVPLVYGTEES